MTSIEKKDMKSLPDPLQINFGTGGIAVSTYDDDNKPGILLRDAKGTHKIGEFPSKLSNPHYPEPGEVYLTFQTIESVVVFQDALTYCMRKLCGFPEYVSSEEEKS